MASLTLLCFYQLAARILMDSMARDYVNGALGSGFGFTGTAGQVRNLKC